MYQQAGVVWLIGKSRRLYKRLWPLKGQQNWVRLAHFETSPSEAPACPKMFLFTDKSNTI